MEQLPLHLKKYIVDQQYEKYTSVDQAAWRYILRQLRAYLSKHAHESYLDGLEKTGIEIEKIPRIEEISQKLEKFGWRALPVSGFIPPAAFMELQSLGVLPIASDMRTLEHLTYTPAPDIVHEAAGHAPLIVQPEYAQYLREYAQVARKAIISKEDLDLYEAIRNLSDIKESPSSRPEQIAQAQAKLEEATKKISHVSEATELGRMNWWTAEYGLVGDLENPKIFGAGLLSSVGESKWCLNQKVKKIPLTVDCIQQSYDITEPQPQLFVTPDFKSLSVVLNEMADKMAFETGGAESVQKIIRAKTVNSVELNSGIQISGICTECLTDKNESANQVAYLKFQGPCQLSYQDQELPGHSKTYHKEGFGTPVGFLKNSPQKCLSLFSEAELKNLGLEKSKPVKIEFVSGVVVEGALKDSLFRNNRLILLAFENCKVTWNDQTLFDPSWGIFDMAVGSSVPSVFGGPADRARYGETDDFVAPRIPLPQYSETELTLQKNYQAMRDLRESKASGDALARDLKTLVDRHQTQFPQDWLLLLEAIELSQNRIPQPELTLALEKRILSIAESSPEKKSVIEDGLSLSNQL